MTASPNRPGARHSHPGQVSHPNDDGNRQHDETEVNGREANGRFAKGNPGGPGNPYYRRQAELKRMVLESVTDVDVMSVMRVLLGIARGGDLAAIKLFLEYTVGKPNTNVDPDKAALHEWDIQKQTPKIEQVAELMSHGVDPELASLATRDMADIVGACHIATIGRHLVTGVDPDGNQMMPPLDEDDLEPELNSDKRHATSSRAAQMMSAGVPETVQPGDNGGRPDMNSMIEEMIRAVRTVENGRERVIAAFRLDDKKASTPVKPDTR